MRTNTKALWDSVDWSLSDEAIAEAVGRSLESVQTERRWRETDWSLTNPVIAEAYGCTRQAVAAQRSKRGAAAPLAVPEPADDATIREIAGWRIAQQRARLRLDRKQLAERVGGSWTHDCLWKIENGKLRLGWRRLTLDGLVDFAAVLEVTPADLLARPGQALLDPPGRGFRAETIAEIVGKNIRRWRLGRSLSHAELASRLDERRYPWTADEIRSVERGEATRPPYHGLTFEELETFADALEVTPADLVRLPGQPPLKVS